MVLTQVAGTEALALESRASVRAACARAELAPIQNSAVTAPAAAMKLRRFCVSRMAFAPRHVKHNAFVAGPGQGIDMGSLK